jgi:hypothetical protein
MIDLFLVSGLTIAIGLSAFLLFVRKKKWCTDKFRLILTGVLFISGLLGLFLLDEATEFQISFFKWLQVPLLNSLLDRLFKFLSYKIHGRDLLLYARGSSDLDYKGKNPNLKTSDYIFSIALIISLLTLPLYGLIW